MTGNANRCDTPTLARFVAAPENAAALAAVRRVLDCVCSSRSRRAVNPLFLHGSPGTGKSYLAAALVHEILRRKPDRIVSTLPAGDWPRHRADEVEEVESLATARETDLLVVE